MVLTPLLLLPIPILLKDDVRNTHVHVNSHLYDNIVSSFLIHWTTHCIHVYACMSNVAYTLNYYAYATQVKHCIDLHSYSIHVHT